MRNSFIKKGFVLGLLATLGACAFAQETFNFAGPVNSVDPAGDADNVILSLTSTAATYNLGTSITFNSGDLTEIDTGTFGSEARIRIRSSRYPSDFADVQPFTTTGFTGTISLVPGVSRPLTGSLATKDIQPGDTLTFEFYESFDDEVNLPDASWANLNFTTTTYTPPTPPSAEDLGTLGLGTFSQEDTVPAAGVYWYKFTITDAVSAARYLDIDNNLSTHINTKDTSLGLFNSSGGLVTSDTADGFNAAAALCYGSAQTWGGRNATAAGSIIRNGGDGTLAPGTYYLAVTAGAATFAIGWSVTTTNPGGLVKTSFYHNDDTGPVWPPASFEDLGTLTTSSSITRAHVPASGRWYKLVIPAIASPAWLDMDTEDTVNFLPALDSAVTFVNDTEIGIYDAAGNNLKNDDDDGSGFRSQLSFGDTTSRGTLTTGADAASADRNGRDGDLPAGTYYIYVGGFNTNFVTTYPGVAVTNSHCEGDVVFNLRFSGGGGGGGRTVSGNVNLQDLSVSSNGWVVNWELLDGFDFSVVESGTATLDASGNYTANLTTNSGSGYVFAVKGVHWLRGGVESIDLTTDLTGINFSLKNGDVDGDNEVGPGDFGALSSAFGSVDGDSNWNPNADLDGDGEVGPSDFGILSANFGEAGY